MTETSPRQPHAGSRSGHCAAAVASRAPVLQPSRGAEAEGEPERGDYSGRIAPRRIRHAGGLDGSGRPFRITLGARQWTW